VLWPLAFVVYFLSFVSCALSKTYVVHGLEYSMTFNGFEG
jgi:hypothetical protein